MEEYKKMQKDMNLGLYPKNSMSISDTIVNEIASFAPNEKVYGITIIHPYFDLSVYNDGQECHDIDIKESLVYYSKKLFREHSKGRVWRETVSSDSNPAQEAVYDVIWERIIDGSITRVETSWFKLQTQERDINYIHPRWEDDGSAALNVYGRITSILHIN